jgi:hypothetical protein
MQIGVGGAAGDGYDSLRRYLPNPSLGPHDLTTAVELAALVLIKDKGAPTGRAIDAYFAYVRAYNGSGPLADAYAARVLADAHAYQGAGTLMVAGCVADPGGYINPFAGEAWALSRNDMGVDYLPLKVEPIRAIGAGRIVDIGSWGMYGPWFDYRLSGGRFAGKCIYVAEHISSILAPGTQFNAGDTVAIAYPGPYWTEWGWAKGLDTPAVTWAQCGCTEMDNVNPGGRGVRALPAQPRREDRAGSRSRADVRGRVVLMRHRTRGLDRRGTYAPRARRVALTVVAAGLVVTAEVLTTLSAATPRARHATHRMTVTAPTSPPRYRGEPVLPRHSAAAAAPWRAAVRFVHDYSAWSAGRPHREPRKGCDGARDQAARADRAEQHWGDCGCRGVGARSSRRCERIRRDERDRQLPGRPARIALDGRLAARRLAPVPPSTPSLATSLLAPGPFGSRVPRKPRA